MDLVVNYNRQYRIPFDRSMSEQVLVDQPFQRDFFIKGQTLRDYSLRKETINSYHQDQHNNNRDSSSIADDNAKDLRINQNASATVYDARDGQDAAVEVKTELNMLQRRYFCIFCKMDFTKADDFIGHLESSHPNGSFVLVKRNFDAATPPLPHQSDIDKRSMTVIERTEHHHHHQQQQQLEESRRSITPVILPETIQNQIKIEPISEDEEDEESYCGYSHADFQNLSTNKLNITTNHVDISPRLSPNNHPIDPSHQLMILNSNSRIGDGPGEYLCQVCNAKFVYKNNLKSHLKRHLGIYPYVCFYPSCGKRYQFKCKLNKHIEQAHAKIKNFLCPIPACPKKYFTRNDLAFHISVTHQERQEIPCHICKKVFNSQKSLQIHDRKFHRLNNIQQES